MYISIDKFACDGSCRSRSFALDAWTLSTCSRLENVHRRMLSSLRAYFEHASKPQNSTTLEETRLRSHWTKHFEGTGDEIASKTRYFRRDRFESSRRSSSKPLDEALRRHWTKQVDEETGRRNWTKKLDESTFFEATTIWTTNRD